MSRVPLWLAAACLLFAILLVRPGTAAPLGGDFTLTGDDGGLFSLEDARGKLVLLTFGYTHCPDVCPTVLSQLAAVLRRLGQEADEVQVILVSLDPARDSPEHLHRYVKYFDSRFVGLTGSPAETTQTARRYGVRHERRRGCSGGLAYTIDHSADLYLIDREGALSAILPFGVPASAIIDAVRELLASAADG